MGIVTLTRLTQKMTIYVYVTLTVLVWTRSTLPLNVLDVTTTGTQMTQMLSTLVLTGVRTRLESTWTLAVLI